MGQRIHSNDDTGAPDSSSAVFNAYIERSWRTHAQRQRDRGLEFVIGQRKGPFLWNIEGTKRVIDCSIGGGVHALGHRNPEIVDTLQKALAGQCDAGLWAFPNRPYLELQDTLAALAPTRELSKSVVTLASTTSVDVAAMCALHMTKRTKILAYQHGYHGHSGFAALVTGSLDEGVIDHYNLPTDHSLFVPTYGDIDAIARLIDKEVAGVILEPMDYETFQPASPEYLCGVAQLCKERGAMFILDETRTGLGRTGRLWAAEHSGVAPDMFITGKGLSGGLYPVSALLMRPDIYESCINGHKFSYLSSLGGNEIACIVARKVLEIASSDSLLSNVRMISAYLEHQFAALCQRHSHVIDTGTTHGCILTLSIRDATKARPIVRAAFEAGLLCHSISIIEPSVIKLLPVLTISRDVADEVVAALDQALDRF
jgi:putrescine aminotransferase